MLGLICPELGVAPLVDPGTDYEDELPFPADPPAIVDQEMDSELRKVFIDVVSLPTMVTPVSDMDGALCAPEEQGPVIAPPAVSTVYGYVLGGAETFVTDIASCIADVGGGFADAQNVSGGRRTRGLHVV